MEIPVWQDNLNPHDLLRQVQSGRFGWSGREFRSFRMAGAAPDMTVVRVIRSGILAAKQHCKGTPWVIRREDISRPDINERENASRKRPPTSNPDQQTLALEQHIEWASRRGIGRAKKHRMFIFLARHEGQGSQRTCPCEDWFVFVRHDPSGRPACLAERARCRAICTPGPGARHRRVRYPCA